MGELLNTSVSDVITFVGLTAAAVISLREWWRAR